MAAESFGSVYTVLLTLLTVLALRSLAVLGRASPWTSAGWACTIGYDCAATVEILARSHLPMHLSSALLAALATAFVVAGIRDEAQGEPWWWPQHLQPTRAQRRAGR